MSDVIAKNQFQIFVSEGKRGGGAKEKELGSEWTEQPLVYEGWYSVMLFKKEENQVILSDLFDREKNSGETGLAIVADERFGIYYVNSDGSHVQILGKRKDQQLDPKVVLRPSQERRAPLIFPSGTTVNLVITEGKQAVKLVQIMKL